MNRTLRLAAAALLLVTAALTRTASAHQGAAPGLDQLVRRSAMIVEARVTALRSEWDAAHTRIHTQVTLAVSRVLKGAAPSTLTFTQLGGTVGATTLAVLGQPSFARDESVVLFMDPTWSDGLSPTVAGEHGKFTVGTETGTGRRYLSAGDIGAYLSDFEAQVQRINAGVARPRDE